MLAGKFGKLIATKGCAILALFDCQSAACWAVARISQPWPDINFALVLIQTNNPGRSSGPASAAQIWRCHQDSLLAALTLCIAQPVCGKSGSFAAPLLTQLFAVGFSGYRGFPTDQGFHLCLDSSLQQLNTYSSFMMRQKTFWVQPGAHCYFQIGLLSAINPGCVWASLPTIAPLSMRRASIWLGGWSLFPEI
ncbi:hypothetical protein DSO57_1015691 [Entomophthora muscae]|uniref:Uncharacterized protein n=1 Tax=Entomophthora muscae TaxID=34485 RepID=A0ACC2RJS8_9FUNG|nr:hypothetical protein DSO57_1015691 [Entomophthora muscae]